MRTIGITILIVFFAALTNAQRIVWCLAAGVPPGYRIVGRISSIGCPKAYVLAPVDTPESKTAASPTSSQPAATPTGRVISKTSTVPEFKRLIGLRNVAGVDPKVTVRAVFSRLSLQVLPSVNGKRFVLSIPVEIRNSSSRAVSMRLSHEWYWGIPPPTDLSVAALKKGAEGMVWETGPGYQVGNLDTEDKTVLEPGQSKTVDVRLNWRGTGSVPVWPVIDDTVPGTYPLRFLLFFKSDGANWYVESEEVILNIEPTPHVIDVNQAPDDKSR